MSKITLTDLLLEKTGREEKYFANYQRWVKIIKKASGIDSLLKIKLIYKKINYENTN